MSSFTRFVARQPKEHFVWIDDRDKDFLYKGRGNNQGRGGDQFKHVAKVERIGYIRIKKSTQPYLEVFDGDCMYWEAHDGFVRNGLLEIWKGGIV